MKRKDILKRLKALGFIVAEGGNHTKILDSSGNYRSALGRHAEIEEKTVKLIEKQLGVKLR